MSAAEGFDDVHRKVRAQAFVESLQDAICDALEAVERASGGDARFREDRWRRADGQATAPVDLGGGRSRVLEGGVVLEKAGVNVSAVYGPVPDAVKGQMPGDGPSFFATGVSLVLHPHNPHAPTTHANFRYIERYGGDAAPVGWFGGGADLTPYVLYEDDARHFHAVLRDACAVGPVEDATAGPTRYQRFKRWCDEYFRNIHRDEARGVGGVFFDHLRGPDMAGLEAFWRASGAAFLPAYLPILERRKDLAYDDALRHWQLVRRGRYVEFNLLHDRGTKFGLQTHGRIESILMSLPPLVRWDYDHHPAPGSPEARLVEVLRTPREWL